MALVEIILSTICINATICPGNNVELPEVKYDSKQEKIDSFKRELNGKHLKIGTVQNYPLSYTSMDSNGTVIGHGVAFEFINLLQERFNFTYEVILPRQNLEGSRAFLDNSLIGLLVQKEIEVAAAFLPMLTDSWNVIRYSSGLDEGEWLIMMKRPRESAGGSGLLAPFDENVWYLILVAVLTFGPCIYLLSWFRYYLTKDDNNIPYTLSPCFWFVYGALIKQGTTLSPDANTTRVLFATWWIFITLLSAFYTANLTAFLTLSKFTLAINDPSDLVKKNNKWVARKGSAVEYVVVNPDEELYILNKMVVKNLGVFQPEHMDADFLPFVLNDYVYVRDKPAVEHLMYDDYKNKTKQNVEETDRCTYVVAPKTFMKKSRGFAYQHNSYLQDLFDPVLLALVEAGIVRYKTRYDLPGNDICPLNLKSKERRLRNSDLSMTYALAGFGIITSSLVFGLEVFYRYSNRLCVSPFARPNQTEDTLKKPLSKQGKMSPGPPPYQSIFGQPYGSDDDRESKRHTINGRDYWVVKVPGGDTRLIPRLSKLDTSLNNGCLFGVMYDSTLLVVGYNLEVDEEFGKPTYSDIQLNFPTEVELCGVIKFGNNASSENRVKSILQNVDMTDNPLVLTSLSQCLKASFLIHDRLEETEYEEVSHNDLWKQFVHIRLQTTLPLFCEATAAGVKEAVQSKRKKIASGQVSFHFPGTKIYLVGDDAEAKICGLNDDPSIEDLMNHINEQSSKKKKKNHSDIEIIPADLILKTTRDLISDKLIKTAVKMMSTQGKPAYCIKVPLKIDGLAMAHVSTKLIPLYNVLVENACRSLRLLEHSLLEQLGQEGIGDGGGLKIPETVHFLPSGCGHFFTRIIPKGASEELTSSERQLLHDQLAIPKSWPFFRKGNAYKFEKHVPSLPLINPHEYITTKVGVKPDTTVAVVRGSYTYHHYMQDQFDDDGWGCAYRSLQTLFSWFRFQGYTDEPIPTHKQIQQCLVKIKDKMSSFIGSKNWIGSTEVSFVLETLLDVQSKIIFANSGSELQSYGPELLFHFQRHGSPIMIGGGVLAHTILGVEYSSNNGDIRYLILDPHYTGDEDIATITSKGWCGWKNNDFWDKTAHYNLCLPLTKPCV